MHVWLLACEEVQVSSPINQMVSISEENQIARNNLSESQTIEPKSNKKHKLLTLMGGRLPEWLRYTPQFAIYRYPLKNRLN